MTTTKIPPPRKLTESEDIDSFDDWWFQAVSYYARDESFKEFFDTPNFTWQEKDGVGRAWQPDGVRDARVGREAMKN